MTQAGEYLRPAPQHNDRVDVARLAFESGTLVVRGMTREQCVGGMVWDDRIGAHRAPADQYRVLVAALLRAGHDVLDAARGFDEVALAHATEFSPRPHQQEAFDAWCEAKRRGVVVLPTGAGKSFLAEMAIAHTQRDTLVIAPTLDLVDQWYRRLAAVFDEPIGVLGGGRYEPRRLTVSTYDSAAIHMERLGGNFGLVVYDEVHHLPGETFRLAAEQVIAPFRLGLTATLARDDGKHRDIAALVGPTVFELGIKDLAGDILADYDVRTVEVEMSEADRAHYDDNRAQYRGFVESRGIRVGARGGWQQFLAASSRSEEGRAALAAYYRQKRLALSHSQKIERLHELLVEHWDDRVIVFANDNDTVYEISERFLCPVITHQTPILERSEVLERFSSGTYRVVATSRVLNEGVDVPEASVAIVLSGTGSVREHVQRLGRILRRSKGKRAVLYELVTADSVESHQNERRREHDAYR